MERGLLVCGNMNIDRIFTVPEIPTEGQSTPISGERTVFGGCGGNVAMAASRIGVKVKLSSVIGRDFPEIYKENLLEAGVDLGPVLVSEDLPSPYCIILSAPGGRQVYAFNLGSMKEQREMDVPVKHLMTYCHVATSDPLFSIKCARELSMLGASIAIDPGMEIFFRWDKDLLSGVLPYCDRFFGNLGEWKHLGELMGWKGNVHSFSGMGVPFFEEAFESIDEAVITLGNEGSLLINKDGITHEEPVDVGEVVDATGAGDAFRGGFYGALIRGLDPKEALRYGNAMGALSIKSEGPQEYKADWERIESLVNN